MVAGFAVRFPKLVEIANPRLIILYTLLQATCITLVAAWFISAKFWEKEDSFGHHIRANMWIGHNSGNPDFAQHLEALNASLCSQLEDYHYWYDKAGFWRYGNFTCTLPCKPGQTKGCMSMQQAYSTRDIDEAFLVTHQQTTQLGLDGQVEGVEDSFVLTAEAMDVSISYFYDLPTYRWDGDLRPHSHIRNEHSTTSRDVATHLIDSRGATRKTFAPGEEIKLSLPYMLELSGDSSGLDALNGAAGVNMAPGSEPKPAPTRLSGMELEVHVDCYPSGVGDLEGCYVSVVRSRRGWAYERRLERSPSGGQRVVVFHGVRLVLVGGGMQRHFHMTTLMSKLTTCVVLMSVPNRLLSLICITLLGHLSVVYRQAIIDTFSLKDYMAGMTSRLMVWNASFVELVDKHLPSGESGISKRRMHERLKSVLKPHKELDQHEVRQLVDYCFKAICNPTSPSKKSVWTGLTKPLEDITTEIGLAEEDTEEVYASYVDSSDFSDACTSNEHINFSSAVALFDQGRKRSFLERFFTPRNFREYTGAQPSKTERGSKGSKASDASDRESLDSDESVEKEEVDGRERRHSSSSSASPSGIQSASTAAASPSGRWPSRVFRQTTSDAASSAAQIARYFGSSSAHSTGTRSAKSARSTITATIEKYNSGERTLEVEKELSRGVPQRLVRLVKDHQAFKEQCKEQLNFLDRVYHHLEQRLKELTQSLERWQRAAESEREAAEQQHRSAQQDRVAAEQHRVAAEQDRVAAERERATAERELRKLDDALQEHRSRAQQEHEELQRDLKAQDQEKVELQLGIETLHQSLEERMAACEEALQQGSGSSRRRVLRSKTHEGELELPVQPCSGRLEFTSEGSANAPSMIYGSTPRGAPSPRILEVSSPRGLLQASVSPRSAPRTSSLEDSRNDEVSSMDLLSQPADLLPHPADALPHPVFAHPADLREQQASEPVDPREHVEALFKRTLSRPRSKSMPRFPL